MKNNEITIDKARAKFSVKNVKNCELDELKFVFSQAEKLMSETDNTFNSHTKKSVTILSFLIAICVGLLSYFFTENDFSGVFSPTLFTVLFLAATSLGIAIYISLNIKTTVWNSSGSEPSKLLNSIFYERKSKNKDYSVIKGMIYSELINYEKRITFNFAKNTIKATRINISIIGLILLPILGLICYLISIWVV